MKKTFTKKLSLLLVFTLMLTAIFAVCVHADDDEDHVKWVISGDNTRIYNGEKTFYLYTTYSSFYIDPETVYVFGNTVDFTLDGDDLENTVYSVSPDAEFIWIDSTLGLYIYATEDGKAQIDTFLAGTTGSFRMQNTNGEVAEFETDKIGEMDALAASGSHGEVVNVAALGTVTRYDLIARDRTGAFAYVYGAVYQMSGGGYCYINYLTLDNSHFDANGEFSYRSGTVTVTVLNDSLCQYIEQVADDLDYTSVEYEYEDDGFYDVDKGVFWFVFALLGFIAPVPFFIIGLKHSVAKKKYWNSLTATAVIWFALALILMITMII